MAVLDDDADFAALLEVLLREEGYRPERPALRAGGDLAEALSGGYDVAILDLHGVAGDDLTVLERLRGDRRLRDLPILVCSADIHVLRNNASLLSSMSHVAALEKPFRIETLSGVLRRLVDGRSPGVPLAAWPPPSSVTEIGSWLAGLGQAIHWAVLDAWIPDARRPGLLRCVATWTAAQRFDPFARVSRRTHLPLGGGLPGRVWVSGRAAWIEDLASDMNFPRLPVARRVGLVSAAAAPVLDAAATIGVVAAYTTMRRTGDASVVDELVAASERAVELFRPPVEPGSA